jgi:hypothetical protein
MNIKSKPFLAREPVFSAFSPFGLDFIFAWITAYIQMFGYRRE